MADDATKSEVLEVFVRSKELIVLAIVYDEGDIGGAAGQLFAEQADRSRRGGTPKQLLSTNDTVRHLWVSPSGSLWVASADGNVGTTAAYKWPAPRRADLRYRNLTRTPKWSVTSLPALQATGLPPSITALWGISDSDVHAGAYGGHLYHWDGQAWTQLFNGPGNGRGTIRAIRGSAPDDVFAVGANSTVLHFDGKRWQSQRLPIPPDEDISMTGIRPLPKGEVLLSGMADEGGVLFHGSSRGLTEFGRFPFQLVDMANQGKRTLFATDQGAGELFGRKIRLIKTNFTAVAVQASGNRWFFIEPAQEKPSYVEYDPADSEGEWMRMEY